MNQYEPWKALNVSEAEYWRVRYVETRVREEHLARALKKYTHCRHACQVCPCTKEAAEALIHTGQVSADE